jgi:hypothetical protein
MQEEFQNPIDPDKITDQPGSLPYAHHRGSAVIKTTKESVIKSRALSAMEEQTNLQLDQIKQQIELLAKQANEIKERRELSHKIYEAKMNFAPLISNIYYLYECDDESFIVSMIGPDEWGRSKPFKKFTAKIKLLADHTWVKME